MNPEIVPIHRIESFREDGMLFVRTDGILETMVKVHLIIAGLIVVAMTIPIQSSFSSTRTLDLIIYSDGSTHVSSKIDVDSLTSDFELSLFGPSVDNFVAMGESGSLLSGDIVRDKAIVDTLGSSSITVDYDIHDLISKEGRVWTFSFDSPSDYSLLMPETSVIIGMSVLPNNMEQIDEQIKLELSSGPAQIDYIFGTTEPTVSTNQPESSFNFITVGLIIGSIIAVGIVVAIILKKKQSKSISQVHIEASSEKQSESKSLDTETIFSLRSDIREDDKEIVKFISENGGQVFESDLRKKFLQPRTTMWRAVKRLERLGVVEIYKKDLQNMVKLRNDLEEEN
jgi:uncharacterized membrane protein